MTLISKVLCLCLVYFMLLPYGTYRFNFAAFYSSNFIHGPSFKFAVMQGYWCHIYTPCLVIIVINNVSVISICISGQASQMTHLGSLLLYTIEESGCWIKSSTKRLKHCVHTHPYSLKDSGNKSDSDKSNECILDYCRSEC